ncbi:3-demethylubiquinone-9 3-methyltransferase [Bhargavaea cecembensis DSE10]|uniref:3-demethylubiquinone-9 3-methyltransferase n=1 Tax=Bhargavaea cecembensis DSE10 TaxID=1235279 RepID=M7NV82_9BACL|nr:class I SAM-dependent methyltransferase [Bhargavaea cecembensis]EMR05575.1 3-demethylubiquinone-9 3-methyltransferase [Bhargavaea cecembensis DSE10]
MNADFGKVAKGYALYRNDLTDNLFENLAIRGLTFRGRAVADLGAGTGVLTRMLLEQGAQVTGVEPSSELIREARYIDRESGAEIDYVNRYAEDTGLPEQFFDTVTALRAWHWFDGPTVLKEVKRILKPGGDLLIMDSGFVSADPVVQETMGHMKKAIPGRIKPAGRKADSAQSINSFPVEWFAEWQSHGFELKELYNEDYTVAFTPEAWCGRIKTLSWMLHLEESERDQIMDSLKPHLIRLFGDRTYEIGHKLHVVLLKNV